VTEQAKRADCRIVADEPVQCGSSAIAEELPAIWDEAFHSATCAAPFTCLASSAQRAA